jgi:hypothetical protein
MTEDRAHELEKAMKFDSGAADGYNILPAYFPGAIRRFCRPEMNHSSRVSAIPVGVLQMTQWPRAAAVRL